MFHSDHELSAQMGFASSSETQSVPPSAPGAIRQLGRPRRKKA